jgi:HK97 family phage prohead protease
MENAMSDNLSSLDEFMAHHKNFVKGDMVIKGTRSIRSYDPAKRSIEFTMSTEQEDRDRDVIHQEGLGVEFFKQNPAAFFNHKSWEPPVGTWTNVEKYMTGRPKRLEGTLVLLPEGVNPTADLLAKHFEHGSIRAASIGFIPKAVKKRAVPDDKKDLDYYWPGYDILEADLIECSAVTIPANPGALAKSAAEGDVLAREIIEEVLDNWHKDPTTGLILHRSQFEEAHRQAVGERTTVVVTAPTDGVTIKAPAEATQTETPPAAVQQQAEADTRSTTLLERLLKHFGVDVEPKMEIAAIEQQQEEIDAELEAELEREKQMREAREDQDLLHEIQILEAELKQKGLA